MKKMLILFASVIMAVALTGCGGSKSSDGEQKKEGIDSSKGVAERFVNAIIKKDADKAFACIDTTDTTVFTPEAIRKIKELVVKLGKDINDDELDAKTVREEIEVPSESLGYKILNGKKYTGERSTVSVQFVKDKDKKPTGMTIKLVKVDGSWKVEMANYRIEDGFDTSDNDSGSDREGHPTSNGAPVTEVSSSSPAVAPAPAVDSPAPATASSVPAPATASSVPAPAVAPQAPPAAPQAPAAASKVNRYERLCYEAASLMKQLGAPNVSKEDIEKDIEKFKKFSEKDQDKEIIEAEEMIEQFKKMIKENKSKNL